MALIRLLTEDNSDITSFICHADSSCFFCFFFPAGNWTQRLITVPLPNQNYSFNMIKIAWYLLSFFLLSNNIFRICIKNMYKTIYSTLMVSLKHSIFTVDYNSVLISIFLNQNDKHANKNIVLMVNLSDSIFYWTAEFDLFSSIPSTPHVAQLHCAWFHLAGSCVLKSFSGLVI